ncbi:MULTISPECIES: ABC transporter substrate-binding protein [Clostridia]|uniref:ABC transporter substrate-binding protein n=1 Tax=Clostridia TaxID=186801 RepID=UPI000EA3BA57|nr:MULTISPECIES: ABC transporter substrate-binding protein [Clostridia]NBJ69343.1 hypothetical protein [Roseburia sp. 1XD42-34]RKI79010.1 hypothetical protein D7V87_07640 [Clostridium sp. 1xD42-85]
MNKKLVAKTVNPHGVIDRIKSQNADKEVFRIGISANLGGHTRELYAGVGLAVQEYLNEEKGAYNIELLWEESSFEQGSTRRAANLLVNRGAEAIIGHLSANQSLVAASIYSDIGIPFLAPGTTHPLLTEQGYDNILRVCGRDENMASEMVKLAKKLVYNNQLQIVYQQNNYGEQLSMLLKRSIKEKGLHEKKPLIISENVIADIDNEDTILFAGTYEGAVLLTEQIKKSNFRGAVIFGDDIFVADFPILINDSKQLYTVSTKKELYNINYEEFSKKYSELVCMNPAAYSVTSYLAAKILLKNIKILKKMGCKTLVNRLKSGVLIGNKEISFSPNGDVLDFEWDIYRIKNRGFLNVNRSDL